MIHQSQRSEHASPPSPTVERGIVGLCDASKTYYKPDGSVLVNALMEVNVTIQAGEYAAIMGASGSGKSTLLNVLGCLDRLTNGQYYLDGADVAQMDDASLSRVRGRKIGFVFQAFNLISSLTLLENVEVPLFYLGVHRAERVRKARELLDMVGLSDRLDHRPSELSGGQQQRAAIARSLVNDPAVILADEPTGNLDSVTGQSVLGIFDKLHARGLTILMVTHDPNIADRCERVIRLKDGRLESDVVSRRTGILKDRQPEAAPATT
ncbi:MAG: ABC transporter ATP-binding protein [Planctomycetes bacterium]|nr:ABC transporter ATP-binding protein [Planctomycetota bacterium]NOG53907.1 ABC transporter ATP-binding protein [Planctomycetota bacterium]